MDANKWALLATAADPHSRSTSAQVNSHPTKNTHITTHFYGHITKRSFSLKPALAGREYHHGSVGLLDDGLGRRYRHGFYHGRSLPSGTVARLDELPVREEDEIVDTPSRTVRVPKVIIAMKFDEVALRRPKLSLRALRERYGNRCATPLRELKPRERSMEHVVPRSQGGATESDNVVLGDKAINNQRGNQSLREAGLVLKIKPHRPRPQTVEHQVVRRPKIPTVDLLSPQRETRDIEKGGSTSIRLFS